MRRTIAGAAAAVFIIVAAMTTDGRDAPRAVAAPPAQQAAFDLFANRDFWYADQYSNNAADLFPLDRTYSTFGATLEQGESAPCAPIASSIWIAYSADRAGRVDVSVEGSGFDAIIAAYEWDLTGDFIPSPPGADLVPLGCAEEASGADASVSMTVTPGREYAMQIGSRAGGGDVRLRASCVGCAPPNDNFDHQHYLYVDAWQPEASRTTTTTNATLQPGEQRPCAQIGATVWYTLYAGTPSDVEISTVGSDFDTVLAVYRLSPANNYAYEPGGLELIACEDDGGGAAAIRVESGAGDGHEYFIQAGGAGGAGGTLSLTVECVPVCPPYNDSASSAEYWEPPIEGYTIPTDGATTEAGEPQPCGDIGKTVWFQLTARGDTLIALDTAGSNFETVMAVYETVGFSPPPGSFDLIDCEAGSDSRIEFDATGNKTYWVQAGGVDGASGQLVLNADCVPAPCPPFNDSVAQPYYFGRPQGSQLYTEFIDLGGATTEAAEPLDCGEMSHTAWWAIDMYEPYPMVPLVFDTRDSDFDTEIAVYEAPLYGYVPYDAPEAAFAQLTPVLCASDGAGNRARAVFDAAPGKRYYVQIGGRGGTSGTVGFEISCEGPCPPENDNVGAAWQPSFGYPLFTDTRAATLEPGEDTPCGNIGNTVWYRIDGQAPGAYTISTAGSDFATVIAVYEVQPFSSPPGGGVREQSCELDGELEFAGSSGFSYLIQIGGVDGAGGMLSLQIDCAPDEICQPAVYPVDTGQGGGPGVVYGGLIGPDTGSGGYLPGARR